MAQKPMNRRAFRDRENKVPMKIVNVIKYHKEGWKGKIEMKMDFEEPLLGTDTISLINYCVAVFALLLFYSGYFTVFLLIYMNY